MMEETRVVCGVIGLLMGAVVVGMLGNGERAGREERPAPMVERRDVAATTLAVVEGPLRVPEPATTRTMVAAAPATAPAVVAAATAPALPRVVRVGEEWIAADRWMRREELAGGVYVTYVDAKGEWRFKEGTGRAARVAGAALPGEAGVKAALRRAGAVAGAGGAEWPAVAGMEVVDPAAVMEDAFPAANTGFDGRAGEVAVSVNRAVQAEDGTFFVICQEMWAQRGRAGELPAMAVEAAGSGWSAGNVGEIEVAGRRLVLAVVVPGAPVAGDRRAAFTLVVGTGKDAQRVPVAMKGEVQEVHLREAAEGFYGVLGLVDGMASVRVEGWTRSADGKTLTATTHRLAEWTQDAFVGQVFGQVADRRGMARQD